MKRKESMMKTIGFLGAGKMAEGILSTIVDKKNVLMAEKIPARAKQLKKRYGIRWTEDVRDVATGCSLIFLAVRPQDVEDIALAIRPLLTREQTIVSIVAGKTLARLRTLFGPRVRLIRVMPNLALRAKAGMCAIAFGSNISLAHQIAVKSILGGAGRTVVLGEKDFDAVTALSGSGPAYFAYMEEAMMEGGIKLGLDKNVARLLAEQTMFGTAKFLRESNMDLRLFIEGVCTKGGTTAAGMKKLDKPAFKKMVAETLAAAAKRSRELA